MNGDSEVYSNYEQLNLLPRREYPRIFETSAEAHQAAPSPGILSSDSVVLAQKAYDSGFPHLASYTLNKPPTSHFLG
jgi:hypothetical protein